jgi:hypothetical protein
MPILSLTFEDKGTLHNDVVLRLDGLDRRSDSYYLALDPEVLPNQEDAEKVRLVLILLLEQWRSDVASVANGSTTHLPYEFDDQCSGWLQVTAVDDVTVAVLPVWSMLEGWAFTASSYAAGQESIGKTKPVWTSLEPQRMTRDEALARIGEAIIEAAGPAL